MRILETFKSFYVVEDEGQQFIVPHHFVTDGVLTFGSSRWAILLDSPITSVEELLAILNLNRTKPFWFMLNMAVVCKNPYTEEYVQLTVTLKNPRAKRLQLEPVGFLSVSTKDFDNLLSTGVNVHDRGKEVINPLYGTVEEILTIWSSICMTPESLIGGSGTYYYHESLYL